MTPTVTFETKCYERDWRYLLNRGRLQQMIGNCRYPFSKRILFINNVHDDCGVQREADKLVARDIIDAYYLVEEHADRALEFFGMEKGSFRGGYVYSISELVSIYLCRTDYLLHFSGDSIIEDRGGEWIGPAISRMEREDDILVANPLNCYFLRIYFFRIYFFLISCLKFFLISCIKL